MLVALQAYLCLAVRDQQHGWDNPIQTIMPLNTLADIVRLHDTPPNIQLYLYLLNALAVLFADLGQWRWIG
jgi:hypothetical protein